MEHEMSAPRWLGLVATAAAVVALAGCGSSGGGSTSGSTTQATASMNQSTQTGASTGASTGTSTSGTGAQNLTVTNALRAELVAAGAAHNSLPVSDYTGLRHGVTYYAFDPATSTYWAGASLVPSSASTPAQVSSQDDGGYLLFTRPAGGSWTVYSVGMAGIGGSPCPVKVPASVLAVWGWGAGRCNPG
jgi:hypothetical protein